MSDRIPKILHLYWGGGVLPYLRYLTIASFKYYNPDWKVVLYEPSFPTEGISWATHEQQVGLKCHDFIFPAELDTDVVWFDMATLGLPNDISEVHKSDFLRWHLLSTVGGVWADMDILFIKPMRVPDADTVVCIGHYGHSIGFLMASEGNAFFGSVLKQSYSVFRKEEYQCIGSILCNSLLPSLLYNTYNLPMDVVYAYDANHIRELYEDKPVQRITDNTIGIHWYAGHPLSGEFLKRTNGGLIKEDSFLSRMIKQFEDERNIH